jgi:hypothetical protein
MTSPSSFHSSSSFSSPIPSSEKELSEIARPAQGLETLAAQHPAQGPSSEKGQKPEQGQNPENGQKSTGSKVPVRKQNARANRASDVDVLDLAKNYKLDVEKDDWSLNDVLMAGHTRETNLIGCYFAVARNTDLSLYAPASIYVGVGMGEGGIGGRTASHLSTYYRAHHESKCFYSWIAGKIDDVPRSDIQIVGLCVVGTHENAMRPAFGVIGDIIEASFCIMLRALPKGVSDRHEWDKYTAMCPEDFRCVDPVIGTNMICPTQTFFVRKNASIRQNGIVELKPAKTSLKQATVLPDYLSTFQMGVAKRYNCGLSYEESPALCIQKNSKGRGNAHISIWFDDQCKIGMPTDVLRFLRVTELTSLSVKWEISDIGTRHQYAFLQDEANDPELEEARRLGINVSGVNDKCQFFSFWLRRFSQGHDVSPTRPTTNHHGIAKCLSIMEAMQGIYEDPVPPNRHCLSKSDAREPETFDKPELIGAKEVASLGIPFTALVVDDIKYGESFPAPTVCTCDIDLYECVAYDHDNAVSEAKQVVDDEDLFTDSDGFHLGGRAKRLVDNSECPLYSLKNLIGMAILDIGAPATYQQVIDQIASSWSYYKPNDTHERTSWEGEIRVNLTRTNSVFVKHRRDASHRLTTGAFVDDTWTFPVSMTETFINPPQLKTPPKIALTAENYKITRARWAEGKEKKPGSDELEPENGGPAAKKAKR